MVVLIVTMAIVLLLVARSWREVAPAALDVGGAAATVDDHGESGAGEAVRSGELPDLRDARRETDEHAEQLQEALAEIE